MVFQERRFENDRAVTSAEAFSVCSNINNLVSEVGKSSVKVPCGGEYFAKETDSKGPTLWRQVWVDARPSLNDCAADDHERASAAKIFCARHLSAAGACVGIGYAARRRCRNGAVISSNHGWS